MSAALLWTLNIPDQKRRARILVKVSTRHRANISITQQMFDFESIGVQARPARTAGASRLYWAAPVMPSPPLSSFRRFFARNVRATHPASDDVGVNDDSLHVTHRLKFRLARSTTYLQCLRCGCSLLREPDHQADSG